MTKKYFFKYKGRQIKLLFRFLIAGLLLSCAMPGISQPQTLTVIRNQNGPPGTLKFSELRSILKGEKQRWTSGTKVTIALMKTTTPIGKSTAEVIYNMSGDALLKFCLGLSYQGNVHAPKFFNTTSELEDYVAQNPGAIGVIDQPLANNDIKIISIDGKSQFNL